MSGTERIAMLMFRHVRKELTRKEDKELTAWRNADRENERVFHGTTDSESILVNIAAFLAEKERGLQRLKERYPGISTSSSIGQRSRRNWTIGIAATILVILSFSLYFLIGGKTIRAGEYKAVLVAADGVKTGLSDFQRGYLAGSAGIKIDKTESAELIYHAPNDSRKSKDARFMLRTDRGGEFILKFPDGTMVRINAETSIKYPANFSQDTINVSLAGEAYFEIPKTTGHYYTISLGPRSKAEGSRPKAQGSTPNEIKVRSSNGQFNVTSYPDDSLTFVTLVNGSANLALDSTGTNLNSTYELKPGQQARLMNHKIAVLSAADTAEVIAWKNGQTIFRDANIQSIMQVVSRWYNVDVNYKGGIPDIKLNINIPRNADLKVLLDSLKKQGILVSLRGKTVTVVK